MQNDNDNDNDDLFIYYFGFLFLLCHAVSAVYSAIFFLSTESMEIVL